MKKHLTISLLFFLLLAILPVGCKGAVEEHNTYQVYYLNREESRILPMPVTIPEAVESTVETLLAKLQEAPSYLEYKAPIQSFECLSYEKQGETLTLNFSESYRKLPPTNEVLIRAAIVYTMTQIPGIEHVVFQIGGEVLFDSLGNTVGVMNASTFLDSTGSDMTDYEEGKLVLYFANVEGTGLVKVNRELRYNANISLDKLVVEQLIAGPTDKNVHGEYTKAFPIVNPTTKIVSVTTKDGICYVNVSQEFMNQIYNVSTDVAIYGIVNSLAELPNINKVQFLVEGDSKLNYQEKYSLSTIFERNLDLPIESE